MKYRKPEVVPNGPRELEFIFDSPEADWHRLASILTKRERSRREWRGSIPARLSKENYG